MERTLSRADNVNDPEWTVGPTPNGGTYSLAYFRDDQGNPVPKDRAAQVEITEFDAAGRAIMRTYGQIGGPASEPEPAE